MRRPTRPRRARDAAGAPRATRPPRPASARHETAGPGADAADGSCGDFEDVDAFDSLTRHSTCTGPWYSPIARTAIGDGGHDALLHVGRRHRGRAIDRLLEERTIERIRLVEDRQYLEHAMVEQPLDRVLSAGNESLDDRPAVGLVPLDAHVWRLRQRPQPPDRCLVLRGVVRPAPRRGCLTVRAV